MTSPDVLASRRFTPWQPLIAVVLFAVMVKLRWFAGADQALTDWILARRTPATDAVMRALTFFGSTPWALGVMGLMSVWWIGRGDRRTPVMLWGAWGLGIVAQILLRVIVAQWRPDAVALPAAMDLRMRFELAGFPSGHGFRSAFLYGWWAQTFRQHGFHRVVAAGCCALALVVGLTRMSLGRHWMSDIIGSWLLALWVLSVARSWRDNASDRRPA